MESLIKIGIADDDFLIQEDEEDEDGSSTGTLDLGCSPLRLLPPPIPPNQNKHSHADEEKLNDKKLGASKKNDGSNQMKRRKKGGVFNFNLRKSLAWNNAFFTEEGVLNQQELSRLTASRTKFLPGITEESSSNPSGLQPKSLRTSPLRRLNKDPNLTRHLSPKLNSNAAWTSSKTSSRKLDLVKGVNKSLLRSGGCSRHLGSASQKRLPCTNLRNALTKEVKIPKLSVSKSEHSGVLKSDAKRSILNPNRQEDNLEKNAFLKGSSNTSKTPTCISLTSRSSGITTTTKATSRLKMPDHVPNVGTNTSKVVISLPQNARGGNFINAQFHATKPSGLRMPSPSLGYFSQPEAPTSLGVKSPRNTHSCNLREASIPSRRKFGDSCHTGEIRPSDEPAGTMIIPEVGINAMKCLVSSTATMTTSYPSFKSNKEFKRSIVEILKASALIKSEREFNGIDNTIVHQIGVETHKFLRSDILADKDNVKAVISEVLKPEAHEHRNPMSRDVEKVQQKENCISHSGRLAEQRNSEESIKDNVIGNLKGNESKNKDLSKANETIGLSHSSISDSELQCELKNALQRGCIKTWQIDDHPESFVEFAAPENEEFNASDVEVLRVAALVNSETRNCGISGAEYLVEHMNAEKVDTSFDDIGIPVAHSDCLEDGDEVNTVAGEQEVHKKTILDQVEHHHHSLEQDKYFQKPLEDDDPVNSRCQGLKNGISSNSNETIDPPRSKVSDGERKCEFENSELRAEDKGTIIPLEGKSLEDSSEEAVTWKKHKLNAAPFSDEWVAALEEVGEEILTRKTGAVQNSPPDKSLPEPGPWSPVKRKNIPEIGPFDCTKYTTNLALAPPSSANHTY